MRRTKTRPKRVVTNEELKRLLEFNNFLLGIANRRMLIIMSNLSDLNAAIDALETKVEADDDVISSIATYVQGIKQQLTDTQAQLADAIAANDPAAIDSAMTKLSTLSDRIDAQTVAEKAITNTPADTGSTGGDTGGDAGGSDSGSSDTPTT